MRLEEATIGTWVIALRDFHGVPRGTRGVIDEDYGSGFMVAWNLPGQPLPPGYCKYDGRPAAASGILRDGFDKEAELKTLAAVPAGRMVLLSSEWKNQGRRLFGTDPWKWRFQCPNCGNVQTIRDFAALDVDTPERIAWNQCIGRFDKSRGCDWALGGKFQIHTLEVIGKCGEQFPVFEYAEEESI